MRIRTLAAAAILLTMSACSQPAETAAPLAAAIAPTAVAEPEPTAEPTPAPTPQPAATAEPTPTPQPTATPQPTVNPIDELPALMLQYQTSLNDSMSDEDAYLELRAKHSWYEGTTSEDIRCGIVESAGKEWEHARKNLTTVFYDLDSLVATPNWLIPNTDNEAGDNVYAVAVQLGFQQAQIHVALVDGQAKFFPVLCADDTTA